MSTIRIATFNVSIETTNYSDSASDCELVKAHLASGTNMQLANVAEIIQRIRPDVILLNEFDFITPASAGIEAFLRNYLNHSQQGCQSINYPYYFVAPVNSGEPSPFDIDGDGVASGTGGDAYGFGYYPGQYGMALLSRFPIQSNQIRTFRKFLWKDMPNATKIRKPDGSAFYDQETHNGLRLSSKSHWDVPIEINGKIIHVLAAHPTPPVFDGPERRNRARNNDEIRFWADYISPTRSHYIYDDLGASGGLTEASKFVVLGDYNASPNEGDSQPGAIQQLLEHPQINANVVPTSLGAKEHTADSQYAASHTASWRARVDYVLPERTITVNGSGVFWPPKKSKLSRLIKERASSSDHRLVWLDITLD